MRGFKREKFIRHLLPMGLLLVLAVTFFVFWANQKELWFVDEIYTYESANGFETDWPHTITGKWQTKAEVEQFFAADDKALSFDAISIHLYNDHVPLYFWLFRTISVLFFAGSGSIWIGYTLNLAFYILSLLLIYTVANALTRSRWSAFGVTLLSGVVNLLMLEQAMTLRMYMMLFWAMMVLLLCSFWFVACVTEGKKWLTSYLALFAASLFGLLTHYDFWIFYAACAAICCLYLLFLAIRKKDEKFFRTREFRAVCLWVGNFVAAFVSTLLLFPYARWKLNTGKGEMAIDALFVFSKEKLADILMGYQRLPETFFGEKIPALIGLLLMMAGLCFAIWYLETTKRKRLAQLYFLTVAIAELYQLAVCFTFPTGYVERYLWGSYAILHLCMLIGWALAGHYFAKPLADLLGRVVKNAIVCRVLLGLAAVSLFVLLLFTQARLIGNGDGIAYLRYPGKDVALLEEKADLPWIVYGEYEGNVSAYGDWRIPEEICFLEDASAPESQEAIGRLQTENGLILYVYEREAQSAIAALGKALDAKVQEQYLFRSTNYLVYLIEW
jgi:hypothetical protein